MKIAIIGPYPPPYGGISVHIKRMKRYLENRGSDVTIYNEVKGIDDISKSIYSIKSYKKFIFKIPFLKADIIHFHSIDIRVRILLGFYKLFTKRIVLTIHGESFYNQVNDSNKFIKKLLLNSLRKIDKIICVNPKIITDLYDYGIKKGRLAYIPAYNNPIADKHDIDKIPQEIWHFIKNSKFLISANGWIKFNHNEDLYGIDVLIELIFRVKHSQRDIKLLIALLGVEKQNLDEKKYYSELKNRMIKLGLQDNIYIYEVIDTEFYPILQRSQLFLRPTNTDGYSVSIAESIYYKVPNIASDVCKRPEGTIIFKNRNIDDLYNKTVDVIENYQRYKDKLKDIIIEDNAEKILRVYEEVLKE